MVEFAGLASVKAQLGASDMRLLIQFALSYPHRWAKAVPVKGKKPPHRRLLGREDL